MIGVPKPKKLTKKEKLKLKRAKLREKKTKSPSVLKKKCDVLFSKIIRLRDGKCLYCGSTENLQCAHIASRKNLAGRWNENNAVTLCLKDHIYGIAHKEPLLFHRWLRENYPDKLAEAEKCLSEVVTNINYEVLLDQLKERLEEFTS